MKALLVLVAIFAVAFATRAQFDDFKTKYNKVYESAAQERYRFKVFEENLKLAEQRNLRSPLATHGVTKFMDLTPTEFRQFYLMAPMDLTSLPAAPVYHPQILPPRLPSEYDWKTKHMVTAVKNQEQCGSCWAFSATETIESVWAIAGHALTSLAPQQIVSCDTSGNDQGCEGGFPYGAYEYIIHAGGQETESDYPYTATDSPCDFKRADILAKIASWKYVTQSQDENAMQQFLYSNSPLSVCVDAESWQTYTGGVVTVDDNCGNQIDHCVQATGWSNQNSTKVWNVRNSWGGDWGESGYIYVEFGHDVCGIAQLVTVPAI